MSQSQPVNMGKSLHVSNGTRLVNAQGIPVTRVSFGFGWDVSGGGEKGLKARFNRMKGVDLDASVIAFDESGTAIGVAYYDNLRAFGGAITHTGDNRTGKGDGYDEVVDVFLDQLPEEVQTLVCTLSSYKGANFEKVNNAEFGILDGAVELAKTYLPVQSTNTAAIMAKVVRVGDGWEAFKLTTLGHGRTWRDLARLYSEHVSGR